MYWFALLNAALVAVSVLMTLWLSLRLVERNTRAMAGLMVDAVQSVVGTPLDDPGVMGDPQEIFNQPLTDDMPPWAVDSGTGEPVIDPATGRPMV